jgi:transposase
VADSDNADARSLSQDAQEALRVRGVKLLEVGYTQVQVAEVLGVGERQVRRWVKRFRKGGWKALQKRRRGRRPREQEALSAAQQQRVVELIRSKNPDQLRIPALLWTRGSVQDLIERDCGVRLEVGTVGRYLRRWGFTLKRPTRRALEADPVVVEAWLSEVYPKIRAQAKKDGGLILWQDESGLRLDRLWAKQGDAPRGQRAVAPSTGNRQGINMISALANTGELRFSIFEGRFNGQVFIDFLDRLIRSIPDRKLHLICDNHSGHHAKIVKKWVAEHAERIELHFLPAHSPELNPDEQLNQDVKRHMREVYPKPTTKATLREQLASFLHRRQRQPYLVCAYFQEASVRYAAA